MEYRFFVKSTMIGNAIFSCKTAPSEDNVNTNRMGSTRWNYHKERNVASNYFSFSKILFQFNKLIWKVDLMHQLSKCLYSYFFESVGVLFEVAFSLWVSLNLDREFTFLIFCDITFHIFAARFVIQSVPQCVVCKISQLRWILVFTL